MLCQLDKNHCHRFVCFKSFKKSFRTFQKVKVHPSAEISYAGTLFYKCFGFTQYALIPVHADRIGALR